MAAVKELHIDISSVELHDTAPPVNISGRMERKLNKTKNGRPWLDLSLVSLGGTRMVLATDVNSGKSALIPLVMCVVYPE